MVDKIMEESVHLCENIVTLSHQAKLTKFTLAKRYFLISRLVIAILTFGKTPL